MEKENPSHENPESLLEHLDDKELNTDFDADAETEKVHQLELEIEQQKLLRLKDAKQVEEKAAKIKEWVCCKLKELEQQNLHLREQNLKCNQQLQILKTHIENQSSSCCSSKSSVDCSLHAKSATAAVPEDHPTNPHFWSMTSTFPQYQLRKNMGMNQQDLKRDLISAIDSLNLDGCSTSPKTIKCSTDSDTDPAHDYAEIYTPCRENYNDWILKGSGDESSQSVFKPPQPPTPPLHRFPSWEAKIYEVANDGLIRSDNGETSLSGSIQIDASTEDFGKINIPVYATVKGRASQIRSMPFSGDSSDDSSDGEMHNSDSTLDHGTFNKSEKSCSPSKSFKTASNADVRTYDSPRNPRREMSIASGISEDYAVPPDAVTEMSPKTVLDNSLMTHSYTNSPNKKTDLLEKSGQLSTLGGKLKTWRKRFFVLKNGTLSYWKNQVDVSSRSPQGTITLNEQCVINRPDSSSTFEILTKDKNYYLTAETYSDMDEWVRVLQNVQKLYTTQLLLNTENQKPSIEGWVTKVKNGHAKKCWCILMGKTLMYFKTSQDKSPLGQLNMRETKVEGVEHTSDSESDTEEKSEDLSEGSASKQTIAIYPTNQDPIYLIFSEKHEFDNWLYHLIVVSGGSGSNEGTEYERLVQKLMESDGDPNSDLWYNPVLLYSKNAITTPLSTLVTDHSQSEAIKLFKSCQLFMSVAVSVPAIDYHIVLAQNALQVGLDMPELQTELFCGLIKQTTKYTGQISKKLSKQKRSHNSSSAECKHNPPAYSLLQGWQLLSLACSLFVPKNKMLWYLKMHLSRNVDVNSDTGKYAAYCERALQRTLDNGGRTSKPSRMEILSIIMKNPYHHSLPHAIPVHMTNGSYHVSFFLDFIVGISCFSCCNFLLCISGILLVLWGFIPASHSICCFAIFRTMVVS
ncbi:PLEKHH2 family protein [Megaselia abdita]